MIDGSQLVQQTLHCITVAVLLIASSLVVHGMSTGSSAACVIPSCEDSVTYSGPLGTCESPISGGACVLGPDDAAACPVSLQC